VQRISKSSLNPRGPLTKTLGVLANPRSPDKPRCPGQPFSYWRNFVKRQN
jgi:hypothetical protein